MRHFTRRDFARSAGLATLFAPFLATLESKPARAATGKAKYLLLFVTPGTDVPAWSPRGSSESSITFSAMTEPLAPLKDKLVIIEKLSSFGTAASHGSPGGLTGMGQGNPIHVSIDQFISDGLRAANVRTQIPNVVLGGVPTEQPTSFYKSGRALSPIASPTAAYQAVFGGGGNLGTDMGTPTAAEDRLRRRKSVLDLVSRELGQLSQTLGSAERHKLDVHVDSIRQLEARITQQTGTDPGGGVVKPVNCTPPGVPTAAAQHLQNSVLHLDIAVNAFACDLTRVASVQFGHHQSTQVTISQVGEPGDWHNGFLHSDPAPRKRLVELERWLCAQFVAAADKLKKLPAPDGAGTLYDQTLMVWVRDMGDGVIHDGSDMRFVFAGGAGGYLKTSANGRYLTGNGDYHMRALCNVGEAMGITSFTGFGDPSNPATARTPFPGIASV